MTFPLSRNVRIPSSATVRSKLGVGVFVGREQIVPYDGRVLAVDDFQGPSCFALKPDDLDSDRNSVSRHRP